MPVIRFPDGTEVNVPDSDDEPPAHLRRGRFDKRRKNGQTERQRLEGGLSRMYDTAKKFLLDDDPDDINVIRKMLDEKDDG